MRGCVTLAALALGTTPAALAQAGADEGWRAELKLTLAGSSIEDDSPLAPAGDGFAGSGSLLVTRSDTFESGFTLKWRGEARVERDAAARPSFAGVLGDCPAANALCPRASGQGGFVSPISPATGLAADGPLADEEGLFSIESASVSLETPWGEGVLGLDSGVAAILDARPPTVLERVSAFSPGLDPTGLVTTRARNDVTGPSAKISYMSPRWIGFRLGASFTPKADQRGVDFDPDFGGAGLGKAELEEVWEGAASFARQFAQQDLRVRAALTYSAASSSSGVAGFGRYKAWGAGLELERGRWTGGMRWLSSNNAWDSGNGDYEAWEIGLVRQGDEWRIGVEAGWSEDRLNRTEGASWLAGVSRKINEHADLGLAWTSAEADLPVLLGPTFSHTNARNNGLILELTVRN